MASDLQETLSTLAEALARAVTASELCSFRDRALQRLQSETTMVAHRLRIEASQLKKEKAVPKNVS